MRITNPRARHQARLASTVLAALCVSVYSAQAQAPLITAAGDPSVRADSMYALAVDPASHPQDGVVLLFDDGVARLDASGRGSRTYRQIVQVLRQQAVAAFAERRLRYSPAHEKLTLNWARVLRPSGEVISDRPAQMQESDVPAALANPVYVNQKELRLSLGGVGPNTIIDISYTIEESQPYLEGNFYSHWNVHTSASAPVLRSRFILDVPASVQPRITERNLNFAVRTWLGGGRRAFTWATAR
jgi:hypothetical protein